MFTNDHNRILYIVLIDTWSSLSLSKEQNQFRRFAGCMSSRFCGADNKYTHDSAYKISDYEFWCLNQGVENFCLWGSVNVCIEAKIEPGLCFFDSVKSEIVLKAMHNHAIESLD